jgi:hypothetical protein
VISNSRTHVGCALACVSAYAAGGCSTPAPAGPPVALVSADQEVVVGSEVAVSGEETRSSDGAPLSLAWALRSRAPASAALLDDASAAVVHFTADAPGTYVVALVATDRHGSSPAATCVVIAHRDASLPVAVGGDDVVAPPGEIVLLDGSRSTGPRGTTLEYSWSIRERPPASAATLSDSGTATAQLHTDVLGLYRLELVVSAGTLASEPDSVIVFADHPPVADAGPDLTVGIAHHVTLDARGTYDLDGEPLVYGWRLAVRPASSTASLWSKAWFADFTTDQEGDYQVQLTVGDWATTTSRTVTIHASAAYDQAPVAVLDGDQTVNRGARVSVSAEASYDPDGDPLTYTWTFVSKPFASAASIAGTSIGAFTADQAGTYVVTVQAADRAGMSGVATVTIEALQQPLPPDILDPKEVYLVGTLVVGSSGFDALAHWSTPSSYNAGFDGYFYGGSATINPVSGRLMYTNVFEYRLREYHRDGGEDWLPGAPYPRDVLANDPITATPPCVVDDSSGAAILSGFLVASDGSIYHRCYGGTAVWYDASGVAVFSGADLLLAGSNQLALTATSIVDLPSGSTTPVTGLPSGSAITRRATATGFWVVLGSSTANSAELWLIDVAGAATLAGAYPDLPVGIGQAGAGRLDGSGRLFQFARTADYDDVIVRRIVGGDSEIVYDERDKPAVKIHISYLVTGP